MRRLLCCLLAALGLLLLTPGTAWAQVHQHENEAGVAMVRSLESLRDLRLRQLAGGGLPRGPSGPAGGAARGGLSRENCGSIIR